MVEILNQVFIAMRYSPNPICLQLRNMIEVNYSNNITFKGSFGTQIKGSMANWLMPIWYRAKEKTTYVFLSYFFIKSINKPQKQQKISKIRRTICNFPAKQNNLNNFLKTKVFLVNCIPQQCILSVSTSLNRHFKTFQIEVVKIVQA